MTGDPFEMALASYPIPPRTRSDIVSVPAVVVADAGVAAADDDAKTWY